MGSPSETVSLRDALRVVHALVHPGPRLFTASLHCAGRQSQRLQRCRSSCRLQAARAPQWQAKVAKAVVCPARLHCGQLPPPATGSAGPYRHTSRCATEAGAVVRSCGAAALHSDGVLVAECVSAHCVLCAVYRAQLHSVSPKPVSPSNRSLRHKSSTPL